MSKAESATDGKVQTELVFGLVGAIGTRLDRVAEALGNLLGNFGYEAERVKVSSDIIAELPTTKQPIPPGHYPRAWHFMTAGNDARVSANDAGILAYGVATHILNKRPRRIEAQPDRATAEPRPGMAYIIDSLKNPAEVEVLRDIYGHGFYLVGVYEELATRRGYLAQELGYAEDELERAIKRDEKEADEYGQQTAKTFELSDFFLASADCSASITTALIRFLDIVFGDPQQTSWFDEYAMFLAFAASLRSGDIARQVGAVLVSPDRDVLALGSNDVPAYGGGPYWPDTPGGDRRDIMEDGATADAEGGRRIHDPNKRLIEGIVRDIGEHVDKSALAKALTAAGVQLPEGTGWLATALEVVLNGVRDSELSDITEFGRSVHAEMEALLACSRSGVSARGATLYCTTFPCHNCAKHIVDAGVRRVVYVEPYPKSRAYVLHSDAIQSGASTEDPATKVEFIPFTGVGPRRFLDLFSLRLGAGRRLERKLKSGQRVDWQRRGQLPRLLMEPRSYLDNETLAAALMEDWRSKADGER